MKIYVEEIDSEHPIITYTSKIIPRKDEILYFVHYGAYKVIDIIYRITDDNDIEEDNKIIWIELKVEKSKENKYVY